MRLLIFISAFVFVSCGQKDKKQKEKDASTATTAVDTVQKNTKPPASISEKLSLTGTYKMINGESTCTITVDDSRNILKFKIFAWWGTQSGRHGEITGRGLLDNNNSCQISITDKMSENNECSPSVTFTNAGLTAVFKNCEAEYNVPEDFSGDYKKISSAVEEN